MSNLVKALVSTFHGYAVEIKSNPSAGTSTCTVSDSNGVAAVIEYALDRTNGSVGVTSSIRAAENLSEGEFEQHMLLTNAVRVAVTSKILFKLEAKAHIS